MTRVLFVGSHAAVAAALCGGAPYDGPEPEGAVAEALEEVDLRLPLPPDVVDTDEWGLAEPVGLCLEEARELVAVVAARLQR